VAFLFFFFFSSRRRHTRFSRDWSSDVCSSDLCARDSLIVLFFKNNRDTIPPLTTQNSSRSRNRMLLPLAAKQASPCSARGRWPRSEERRVGKECGCRRAPDE